MLFTVLSVFVALSSVPAQAEEEALPKWWITTPDPGQIPSATWCGFTKQCYDSDACDIKKYKNIEFNESPTSFILIKETDGDADVCIIFPNKPNKVNHGKGKQDQCHDGCCTWTPPSKKIAALEKPPLPRWYETTSGSCSGGSAVTAPFLFNGRPEESPVSLCVEKDGDFELRTGKLGACARGCCGWFDENPPQEREEA